jgi:Rieske Fe-S protein
MTDSNHTPPNAPPNAPPDGPAGEQTDAVRRAFLKWSGLVLGGAATTAVGATVVGYVLAPGLGRRADRWVDVGPVDSFPEHQTRRIEAVDPLHTPWDGLTARIAMYVSRQSGASFRVFSVNCTHLGCPVKWFPASGLFMCPCHGGVYYADGQRAAGPPPRGLYRYEHHVEDGRLLVLLGHLPTLQEPA